MDKLPVTIGGVSGLTNAGRILKTGSADYTVEETTYVASTVLTLAADALQGYSQVLSGNLNTYLVADSDTGTAKVGILKQSTSSTTTMVWCSDTDAVFKIGRVAEGYPGGGYTDSAAWGHIDHFTPGTVALRQPATGDTIYNCAAGKTVTFRTGGSATGMQMASSYIYLYYDTRVNSGKKLYPQDASGQDLGDSTHLWDVYAGNIYYCTNIQSDTGNMTIKWSTTTVVTIKDASTQVEGFTTWLSDTASQPQNVLWNYTANANSARLQFKKSRGTTTPVNTNDVLGLLDWRPYSGGGWRATSEIRAVVTTANSTATVPSELRFSASDSTSGTVRVMDLDETGLELQSGYTARGGLDVMPKCYAEIYVDGGAIQSMGTGTSYVKLTAFDTNGESNDAIPQASTDTIAFNRTGHYLVNFNFSGITNASGANTMTLAAHLNGAEQVMVKNARDQTTAGQAYNISATGFIDVTNASHELDLRIKTETGNPGGWDVTAELLSMSVLRIGDT